MITEDERHALMWLCRKYSKSKTPDDCGYCNNPIARGLNFKNATEKRKFIRQTKRQYGCIGKAMHPFKFDDGYELYTCPNKFEKEFAEYFRAYAWIEHQGIFPFGEFEDQSEKFILIMETIRTEYRKMDKEDANKMKEKWQKK